MIEKCLEDLERRINPETEEALLDEWRCFVDGEFKGDIFSPKRKTKSVSGVDWPEISVNKSFDSFENMALQQFFTCSCNLEEGDGALMNVRSNYGTGIMSTLFGCELFMMEEKHNTLPTSIPLTGGSETIRKLLDRGMPELTGGLAGKALEMGEYFVRIMKDYPNVKKYVYVYHPDLQGPMDVCELIWGSEMFLGLIDEPELAKDFLELITETYIALMKRWTSISPFREKGSPHWGALFDGHVMLRDDSAMNLSPEIFSEFVQPYDFRIIEEFGGSGGIHFCGRGDHYIENFPKMGVTAVPMSQPEYNDMEKIYRNTIDKDIKLLLFSRSAVEEALKRGRSLNGNVHCLN
jgi:hypothetical protein